MFWPFTVWGFLKPNFRPHEYWISRTCCCNSTYRLRYWNPAINVSMLLGVAGCNSTYRLRYWNKLVFNYAKNLAGTGCNSTYRLRYWNLSSWCCYNIRCFVATVLTACGIETLDMPYFVENECELQQYLPLAVLKLVEASLRLASLMSLGCNSTYRLRYWNCNGCYA